VKKADKPSSQRAPRYAVSVRVKLQQKSQLQTFFSRNLSEGGMFLEVEELVPVGRQIELQVEIPGQSEPLRIVAEVVHHHRFSDYDEEMRPIKRKGMGLRFVSINPEQHALIARFVAGQAVVAG
jgi:uncharacterized protein (TIGR02266 family)